MVIGEDFVWAHIGKTGGDFTAAAFRKIRSATLKHDFRYDWRKHETFSQRQRRTNDDFDNKRRIANIRRLPSWCLSFANHMKRNFGLDYRVEDIAGGTVHEVLNPSQKYLLLFPGLRRAFYRMVPLQTSPLSPDDVLKLYEPETVDHWIRLERIEVDFPRTIEPFISLDAPTRTAIDKLLPRNDGKYDRRVESHFTDDQLRRLYEACPVWREIERAVYGNLLGG